MKYSTAALSVIAVQLVAAYDDGIKPCWNIRLNQEAFCYQAIKYPLSTDTFYST